MQRLDLSSRQVAVVTSLRPLHWLCVPQRISFKLAVVVYQCVCGLGPAYLADALQLDNGADVLHGAPVYVQLTLQYLLMRFVAEANVCEQLAEGCTRPCSSWN